MKVRKQTIDYVDKPRPHIANKAFFLNNRYTNYKISVDNNEPSL